MTNRELMEEARRCLASGETLELIRIIRTEGETPRGKNAFMIAGEEGVIGGTVGGGAVEYRSGEDGVLLLREKQSDVRKYNLGRSDNEAGSPELGMACGGMAEIEFTCLQGEHGMQVLREFEEELAKEKPTVWIFGGGHVAKETAQLLDYIGFSVIVYDNRKEFANRERFPGAEAIICAPYEEMSERTQIGPEDYVLVMTRGHVSDYEAQKYAMTIRPYYLGVIGSRAKRAHVREKLLADGFTSEEIAACHAPVGIQVGAETPEEIAVSIAAELILYRAKKENRRKVREHSTIEG